MARSDLLQIDAQALRLLGYRAVANTRRGVMSNEESLLKLFGSEAVQRTLGEADAGIVYVTDITGDAAGKGALQDGGERTIPFAPRACRRLGHCPHPRGDSRFTSMGVSGGQQNLQWRFSAKNAARVARPGGV